MTVSDSYSQLRDHSLRFVAPPDRPGQELVIRRFTENEAAIITHHSPTTQWQQLASIAIKSKPVQRFRFNFTKHETLGKSMRINAILMMDFSGPVMINVAFKFKPIQTNTWPFSGLLGSQSKCVGGIFFCPSVRDSQGQAHCHSQFNGVKSTKSTGNVNVILPNLRIPCHKLFSLYDVYIQMYGYNTNSWKNINCYAKSKKFRIPDLRVL